MRAAAASFSPKLARTVRVVDHIAFEQQVCLEVDPGLISLCQHPCNAGANDDGLVIDFSAARFGKEEMRVVEGGQG